MKYKILKNFNPLEGILTENQLRKMTYEVKELTEAINKHSPQAISDNRPVSGEVYYSYKVLDETKRCKNVLIFLSDFSKDSLEAIYRIKVTKRNYFFYVDQLAGDFEKEILLTLKSRSILPLNFIEYFRKSNFNDWKIEILPAPNMKFDNVVLNTFLELGAVVKVNKNKPGMKLIKSIPLSFQHSIDLYKMK